MIVMLRGVSTRHAGTLRRGVALEARAPADRGCLARARAKQYGVSFASRAASQARNGGQPALDPEEPAAQEAYRRARPVVPVRRYEDAIVAGDRGSGLRSPRCRRNPPLPTQSRAASR